ncbi:uncharacterized, partial [Tachysurus ichikawai]
MQISSGHGDGGCNLSTRSTERDDSAATCHPVNVSSNVVQAVKLQHRGRGAEGRNALVCFDSSAMCWFGTWLTGGRQPAAPACAGLICAGLSGSSINPQGYCGDSVVTSGGVNVLIRH